MSKFEYPWTAISEKRKCHKNIYVYTGEVKGKWLDEGAEVTCPAGVGGTYYNNCKIV